MRDNTLTVVKDIRTKTYSRRTASALRRDIIPKTRGIARTCRFSAKDFRLSGALTSAVGRRRSDGPAGHAVC
jgi:hypothetical protein